MPRSKYTPEEIKKNREQFFGRFRVKRDKSESEKRRDSQRGVGLKSRSKKEDGKKVTTTKKLTGAERAKALAKKNIKKFGGTAKAAAANKEAMRLKIKKAYLAKKKKNKK